MRALRLPRPLRLLSPTGWAVALCLIGCVACLLLLASMGTPNG